MALVILDDILEDLPVGIRDRLRSSSLHARPYGVRDDILDDLLDI